MLKVLLEKNYFLKQKLMFKVIFYKKAKIQYLSIWEYIAQDNLFYANEVLSKIDKSIEILKIYPFIWRELSNIYRAIIEPKYKFKIVYRVNNNTIYIVSVFKYKNSWE